MVYIYCLLLQENKYYIGKTNNPDFRLKDHFNGKGSQWTQLYKPVEILELVKDCDDYDEDKYVRIYMDRYGIDNVRGGSFSKIKLSQAAQKQLIYMSRNANDVCFKCGQKGHFSKNCKGSQEVKKFKKRRYYKGNVTCYRCGRFGHYANRCKNKTHKDGYKI